MLDFFLIVTILDQRQNGLLLPSNMSQVPLMFDVVFAWALGKLRLFNGNVCSQFFVFFIMKLLFLRPAQISLVAEVFLNSSIMLWGTDVVKQLNGLQFTMIYYLSLDLVKCFWIFFREGTLSEILIIRNDRLDLTLFGRFVQRSFH